MSESKEKCKIFADNDPELGNFIEGYDSQKDSNPLNGCLYRVSILFLVGAFLLLISYFTEVANKPHYSSENWPILLLVAIMLLMSGFFLFKRMRPIRVYVYQNGFIWKVVNRKGEEQSATMVNFDDVDTIAYFKTHRYVNGVLSSNTFVFKVLDQQGKTLFRKKGGYNNSSEDGEDGDFGGWMYYSLEAIDQQWTKVGLERMHDQLKKHGELIFKNGKGHRILLSRNGITMDDKSVPWETMKTRSRDGFLWIDDSRKKKTLFSSSDIKLNLNTLPNSQLFLAAFRFLAQQGTISTN